jgi:hypothetical protein
VALTDPAGQAAAGIKAVLIWTKLKAQKGSF